MDVGKGLSLLSGQMKTFITHSAVSDFVHPFLKPRFSGSQDQVMLGRAVGSVTGENIWDYGTPVFHSGQEVCFPCAPKGHALSPEAVRYIEFFETISCTKTAPLLGRQAVTPLE